uniref:Secreted protein n=1 Tax=Vitis vinifera TaxID=29760 RepID=F6I518_VITVI
MSPYFILVIFILFMYETTDCGVDVEPTGVIDRVVSCDEYRDEMDMMSMSQSPRWLSLSLLHHSTCSGCLLLRLPRRSR